MVLKELVAATRAGSIRAATRLISLLEENPARLPELFAGMADWPEPRLVVGLTGAPGVGKSTLVDQLVAHWRRRIPEKRIGVIAVDPSSPFTGGALLGDRVRMMKHATDPQVFIRSLANRGHLGGLTLGISGTFRIMGLAGCEVLLVETVGVGQSEVEVAGLADLVVVLLAPGQGDGVQMLKAGLMEAGNIFVVNKADRPGSERLAGELSAALSLAPGTTPAEHPVLQTSAVQGTGLEELVVAIEDYAAGRAAEIQQRRVDGLTEEIHQSLLEAARLQVSQALAPKLDNTIKRIMKGDLTVAEALREIGLGR